MGQYWLPVNLDKREFIDPHRLGSGLKLWEQLATHPGTAAALIVLVAAMPEARGGGDLADNDEIARRTIGRWAGDRIAMIGDYAEDSDLPHPGDVASKIYGLCRQHEYEDEPDLPPYTDISDDVCHVLERELEGKFEPLHGRLFEWVDRYAERSPTRGLRPDMVIGPGGIEVSPKQR